MRNFEPEARFKPVDTVVANQIGDELVMLDLVSSTYFGLDEIGKLIWTKIGESKSLAAICKDLVAIYDVEEAAVERDVEDLVRQLLDAGLVRAMP